MNQTIDVAIKADKDAKVVIDLIEPEILYRRVFGSKSIPWVF